ncbi:MAG: lytic transglycosylase domain-containing protein [SAR324 cluster bacterium]|uniref:Lytic transglycosylase domain-containing protein n=1 Tax=SAR324 cluster bacterium TaxID=2024889 RepID=A0A7X9IKX2_9DELT|nr:lytic transglycosylase domain-containing protein [SAR324 cluster bacterium]
MKDSVAPAGKILTKPVCIEGRPCHSLSSLFNLTTEGHSSFIKSLQNQKTALRCLISLFSILSITVIALLGIKLNSKVSGRSQNELSIASISTRFKKVVHQMYEVDPLYFKDTPRDTNRPRKGLLINNANASILQKPRMIEAQKPVYGPNVVDVSNIPHSKMHLPSLDAKNYSSSNLVMRKLVQIIKKRGRMGVDPSDLAQKIIHEGKRANFDPLFVAAVIKSESAFDRLAVSSAGARGLMQILPSTGTFIAGLEGFESIMKHRLTDPNYNVQLGIAYLKYLEQLYKGNRVLVLTAYNWGPGRVQDAIEGRRKIPAEVMSYALKILRDHQEWVNELLVVS